MAVPALFLSTTVTTSPVARLIVAPVLSSFLAVPVMVGVRYVKLGWLTTVGTSGGAMSTTKALLLSLAVLPAASVTLVVMA